MKFLATEPYLKAYRKLPQHIQRQVDKQLGLLLENPRHPSLQVKKMKRVHRPPIFELRVTRGYRLTFQVEADYYILRKVGTHDILENP